MKIKKNVEGLLPHPDCTRLRIGDILTTDRADYKIQITGFDSTGKYQLRKILENGSYENVGSVYDDKIVTQYEWKLFINP